MHKFTGAQLLIRLLERQGIEIVAGIPGGANLPLYDALSQSRQIRHILTRHEQAAGFIAQGLARITGTPGVCLATSGPGATNILTAIADAKLDSVPLVCITGQVPLPMIGTDAFQEVDTYGMSIPVTKHNYLARDVRELLEVIPRAFTIAASGRCGPVLIDVPKDVQCQSIEIDALPTAGRPEEHPCLDSVAMAQAVEMINQSARPILYLGGGVVAANACDIARRLAEKASIPAVMTLMGLGALAAGHPLSLGMLGMHGFRYTNLAMRECDLLIALGSRFDDRATGKLSQFCPNAKVIHIDIDPSELHKLRTAEVAIAADVRIAMEQLCEQVRPDGRAEWNAEIASLRQRYPGQLPGSDDARTPYGLVLAAAELAGDDAIVTTDVGQHQMWVAQAYPVNRGRQLLTSGGLGTMGFGLPAAIGAALACPERTVLCFTGDGSLLMNIQELATAAEEQVNVKVIVMNNNGLGLVHQQQALFYGKRLFASGFDGRTDFVQIARGFGIEAFDLAHEPHPRNILQRATGRPGPCLIHAPLSPAERVYPMVPPGGANTEMLVAECA
jgi:acetolactate synthase I/II/III large subunit